MKGRIIMILLAAALVSGAIAAAESQSNEQGLFFAGLVLSVDPERRTVSVEEAGSDRRMSFILSRETEIRRDEEPIRLASVRVGDPVAILYRQSGATAEVISLKVITSPRED